MRGRCSWNGNAELKKRPEKRTLQEKKNKKNLQENSVKYVAETFADLTRLLKNI